MWHRGAGGRSERTRLRDPLEGGRARRMAGFTTAHWPSLLPGVRRREGRLARRGVISDRLDPRATTTKEGQQGNEVAASGRDNDILQKITEALAPRSKSTEQPTPVLVMPPTPSTAATRRCCARRSCRCPTTNAAPRRRDQRVRRPVACGMPPVRPAQAEALDLGDDLSLPVHRHHLVR
jgi:hypothetical protein